MHEILNDAADKVAPRLLGSVLERELDGQLLRVKIVETEAYDQTDVASHSYKPQTARTEVMFGRPGTLYVYFTYGMHYCCNVVVGPSGYGAAVLIRAVEPLTGLATIQARRSGQTNTNLTNGPAKLCQALGIDRSLNGHDLTDAPLRLILGEPLPSTEIIQTTRIGLSKGQHARWRFYLRGNPYVSST